MGVPIDPVVLDSTIHVWSFADAPEFLRNFSECGRDEDWVALARKSVLESLWTPWLEPGSSFGVFDVDEYDTVIGNEEYVVLIGLGVTHKEL